MFLAKEVRDFPGFLAKKSLCPQKTKILHVFGQKISQFSKKLEIS